jgi:hypothetical protein
MKLSLTGNRTDAERKADWMLFQGRVCDDCTQKERAQENTKAALENAKTGLPVLQGSEKQIAWAETLRAKALAQLTQVEAVITLTADSMIEGLTKAEENSPWIGKAVSDFCVTMGTEEPAEVGPLAQKFFVALRAQNRASWWIEARNATPAYFFRQLKAEVLISEEEKALERDVMAEATVQPESPLSRTVAVISFDTDGVSVKFPEKHDLFRETVKGFGCRWDEGEYRWNLSINATQGLPEDRAAELMHRLLKAGFIVCCLDEQVRKKALSASFEPRWPRWISRPIGKWKGYLRIVWRDDAVLAEELSHLPGAKQSFYDPHCWYVRPTEYAALLDFADTHDFRLTPGAQSEINAVKAAEEKRLLAQDLPDAPKTQAKSKAQDTSINGEIDDDLRDED